MLRDLTIANNENLVRNILKFNDVKDLSKTTQVSPTFARASNKFQSSWREAMNSKFSTNCEHYNVVDSQNLSEDNDFADSTNWKELMRTACDNEKSYSIQNKISILNYQNDNQRQVNFLEDLENSGKEIFNSMKEFVGVPTLRKGNPSIETDLNSTLQIHFMDSIFDSQDLYDYYDTGIENSEQIIVKNNNLPFAKELENYFSVLYELDDKQVALLTKIRYYQYSDIVNNQDENLQNILSAVKQFTKTFLVFCKFNYSYIKRRCFENNEKAILNEYSKRYRQFVDACIHLNGQFENLNVLINYLYDNISKTKFNPKFSILRLMMKMWNQEVLEKLEAEYSLTSMTSSLARDLIVSEFSKIVKGEKLSEKQNFFSPPDEESLIEQMNQHFLDIACNEFNTFFIKSSKLNIEDGVFKKWEDNLLQTVEENLNIIKDIELSRIFEYLNNSSLLRILVQRTKNLIHEKLLSFLGGNLRKAVISDFKTYSQGKPEMTIQKVEAHFRMYGDLVEEREEKMLEILTNSQVKENKTIAKYKAIQYIKYSKSEKSKAFIQYQNFLDFLEVSNCEKEYNDSEIQRITEKMNINQELNSFDRDMYSLSNNYEYTLIPSQGLELLERASGFKNNGCNDSEFNDYFSCMISEECLVSDRQN